MKTSPFQILPNSAFTLILLYFISHHIIETVDKGWQCSDWQLLWGAVNRSIKLRKISTGGWQWQNRNSPFPYFYDILKMRYGKKSSVTCLTLYPALALVSMNMTLSSFALRSPSSVDTCRLSDKSVLLPTSIIMTSLPRSVRTSSIHFDVWWNELASAQTKYSFEIWFNSYVPGYIKQYGYKLFPLTHMFNKTILLFTLQH